MAARGGARVGSSLPPGGCNCGGAGGRNSGGRTAGVGWFASNGRPSEGSGSLADAGSTPLSTAGKDESPCGQRMSMAAKAAPLAPGPATVRA